MTSKYFTAIQRRSENFLSHRERFLIRVNAHGEVRRFEIFSFSQKPFSMNRCGLVAGYKGMVETWINL